jgi:4-carboxymuconolactone decarboxylase
VLRDCGETELGGRTGALVRLAALIALEAAPASYQWAVHGALATGASEDDIVAVLTAVAPIVGAARVSSAARELGPALGFEHSGARG